MKNRKTAVLLGAAALTAALGLGYGLLTGAEQAEELLRAWQTLRGKVPEEAYESVEARLLRQVDNAREWRDVINTYFFRYSGIPDAQGRIIYP